MIQTNFHQLLTFTDSRDKSFYFRILKGLKALSDDSFTKYSENYLIFPNILTNSTKFNWSFNPVPTLVYQINVAPRLFILRKKSYLHGLIWYSMLIKIWRKGPKIPILPNFKGNFDENFTSMELFKTPCLFNF